MVRLIFFICLFPALLLAQNEDERVNIEQKLSKNSVFVGEQTLYTFNLNTQTAIYNYKPPDLTLENAWSEVISVNERVRSSSRGQVWNTYSSRRAIYPLSPGTITLPAIDIPVDIRVRGRRTMPIPFGFDDTFNDDFIEQFFAEVTPKKVDLHADSITLEVKPLPPVPAEFTNAAHIPVGATHLTAFTTRDAIKAGDSATLEATVISVGSLNALTELPIKIPTGVRVYAEPPKVAQNENNEALIMRKTFRYSLVPIGGGEVVIPPIAIPYFDPETQTYRLAESPEFKIKVEGAPAVLIETPTPAATQAPQAEPTPSTSAPQVEQLSFAAKLQERYDIETLILAAAALVTFLLLFIFTLFIRKRSAPIKGIVAKVKRCENSDQLSQYFREFLRRTLAAKESQYSYEELCVMLKKREFSSQVEFLALSLLDTFEQGRFSKDFDGTAKLEELKSETLKTISAILKESRKRKNDGD